MRETLDSYETEGAKVQIELDTGGPVGGNHFISVAKGDWQTAVQTDGYDPENWVVNRYFFFGDFNEHHARNFATKIATDEAYRKRSIEGNADWKQVADIYEEAARRIFDVFGDAGLHGYEVGDDNAEGRYREARETWERLCEEVYRKVKDQIRNDQSLDGLDEFIEQRVETANEEAERLSD